MVHEILVDARWLESPEPTHRVLIAMDRLRPGERVRFLVHRSPKLLYVELSRRGCSYEVRQIEGGCYELLINPPSRRRAAWL